MGHVFILKVRFLRVKSDNFENIRCKQEKLSVRY